MNIVKYELAFLLETPKTTSCNHTRVLLCPGANLPLGCKGLILGPPISGDPKILRVRTIYSISVSNYIGTFDLVQRTFFYYAANKRSL